MKKLEEYTNEELVSLYKRFDLFATTQMFSENTNESDERPLIRSKIWTGKKADIPNYVCWTLRRRMTYEAQQISSGNLSRQKTLKAQYMVQYYSTIDYMLRWFCRGWDIYEDKTNPCEKEDAFNELATKFPNEYEMLIMNDAINNELGRATDLEVITFVWETLQWCTNEEFDKLLKFVDKGLKTQWEISSMTKKSGGAHNVKSYEVTYLFPFNEREKIHLKVGQQLNSKKWIMENYPVGRKMLESWIKKNWLKELK